jgi:hypothetical protein
MPSLSPGDPRPRKGVAAIGCLGGGPQGRSAEESGHSVGQTSPVAVSGRECRGLL